MRWLLRGGGLVAGLLALLVGAALVGPLAPEAFGGLALLFGVCIGLLVGHWAAAPLTMVWIVVCLVVGLLAGMDLDGVTRAAPAALGAIPLAGLLGSLWGRRVDDVVLTETGEHVELLAHALSAAGVGVCGLDEEGTIVAPDATFASIVSGWPTISAWWADVITTPLPAQEPCNTCGRNAWRFGRIVEVVQPKGARRAFEISAVGHVHFPGDTVDVMLVSDVSARRERENMLEAAGSEGMTERRVANALLQDLGHEIRTPLAAILGYSELLREQSSEGDAPAGLLEDLERIHTAGQQLEAVVSDLVDLPDAPPASDRLAPESFDLRDLVDALVPTCERIARTGNNRFEVRLAARVGQLVSDPTRIRQIMVNLVSAACRATDRGSITLSVWREGDRIVTVVSDTGRCHSHSEPEPIFSDYWSASTGRSGSGDVHLASVELSVARRLARLLGGDVIVRSRADGNTVMATVAANLIAHAAER